VVEVLDVRCISTGVVAHVGDVIVSARLNDNDVSEVDEDREVVIIELRGEEILGLLIVLCSRVDVSSDDEFSSLRLALGKLLPHPCDLARSLSCLAPGNVVLLVEVKSIDRQN